MFCAYQNTNFWDVRKRFTPSFGGRQSADFLPSPSLAASGAVWTGFRFRFCVGLRPVFAKPPGPPGTGRGQRMNHSYIVRRRGSNYPQGAGYPGVPFVWGSGHNQTQWVNAGFSVSRLGMMTMLCAFTMPLGWCWLWCGSRLCDGLSIQGITRTA